MDSPVGFALNAVTAVTAGIEEQQRSPMNANTQTQGWAHRLGRGLARAWLGYVRQEQRAADWLIGRGVPQIGAQAIVWIVKLSVLGLLLYTAFWIALLLAFAALVAWMARNTDPVDWTHHEEPKRRDGWDGYGLYRGAHRVDCGSVDDE